MRFVVAVHDEHNRWSDVLQVLGVIREPLVPRSPVDHIAGEAHVPEANIHATQVRLQNRLNPRVMLHAISEPIAEDGDNVVLLELKRHLGRTPSTQPWLPAIRQANQHRAANALFGENQSSRKAFKGGILGVCLEMGSREHTG